MSFVASLPLLAAILSNPITVVPLECGVILEGYDTDGDANNGPEIIMVKTSDGRLLATAYFGPGDDGQFLYAEVPENGKIVRYEAAVFAAKYPSPCALAGRDT